MPNRKTRFQTQALSDGMSDEPNNRTRGHGLWRTGVPAASFTFAVLAAYQAAHYATAAVIMPPPGSFCGMGYCTHTIGGKEVPEWFDEYFFWPARKFDDMTGINPWAWHR